MLLGDHRPRSALRALPAMILRGDAPPRVHSVLSRRPPFLPAAMNRVVRVRIEWHGLTTDDVVTANLLTETAPSFLPPPSPKSNFPLPSTTTAAATRGDDNNATAIAISSNKAGGAAPPIFVVTAGPAIFRG